MPISSTSALRPTTSQALSFLHISTGGPHSHSAAPLLSSPASPLQLCKCPHSCPAAARLSSHGPSQHLCLNIFLSRNLQVPCFFCEHDARIHVLTFPVVSLFQSLSYFSPLSCCFQDTLLPFLLFLSSQFVSLGSIKCTCSQRGSVT